MSSLTGLKKHNQNLSANIKTSAFRSPVRVDMFLVLPCLLSKTTQSLLNY
jgi:hypothetical protein